VAAKLLVGEAVLARSISALACAILALLVLESTVPPAQAADPETAPPAVQAVEPIVVNAPHLSVETLIDRKVYSVSTDVQSTSGTLGDVLNAIPSVDVDADGLVSLRGDGNVLILIDGKPSTQLSGSAAGENLQSISASNIDRIEVITTPPAQFKAEGAAGVINIITRKERPAGLEGSLQGSLGSGGRSVLGSSAGYGSGPLSVSLTAGYRHDNRVRLVQSDVRAPDPVTSQVLESRSVLHERMLRDVPSAEVSTRYALDERRTLSGSLGWGERGGPRRYTQVDQSTTPSGTLASLTQKTSAGHDPETSYDGKLGFSRRFAQEGEKLDLSLHRSSSHQDEHYDYVNDAFLPLAPTTYTNLNLLEDHATTEAGADYILPVGKGRSLQLGVALEREDFHYGNLGNQVDPATGAQVVDPAVTHEFRYRQQVDALYASYERGAGPWNALAGVRGEQTRTHFDEVTSGISGSGSSLRFYPSLHVERSLSEETTLSLGVSRRVSRPDPSYLDPYVDHEYAPNLRAGNAGLRPQYTESYEAGYGMEGRSLTVQLTAYYRRNRDSPTDVTQYLGNGVSLTTRANLPRNDAAGIEFSSTGNLARRVSYVLSGNAFHNQIDATALGTPGLRSTSGVNGKLKLEYRPTARDTAQIVISRTDRRLTAQGDIRAINLVNMGYRRQLRRNLTAVATVSDLFNGQRYERFESTPTFTGDYLRSVQGRVFFAGLVYSFGSARKGREAKLEYDQGE